MAVFGHTWESKTNDIKSQARSVSVYAKKNKMDIESWIAFGDLKYTTEKRISEMLTKLKRGDTLLISKMSDFGGSVGQIAVIVDTFLSNGIKIIFVKEQLILFGKKSPQSAMFSKFAQTEKELLEKRIQKGIERVKKEGRALGRPKGPGKSKLDGRENEIRKYLRLQVSKASIAKIMGVSWPCLENFILTRKLDK